MSGFTIHHVISFGGTGWETLLASLARIEKKLDAVATKENHIMAAIDDLESKVSEETTVEESAVALLEQLSTMIKAAGTDPARLTALTTLIDTRKARLATAVAANTPGGPAVP